MSPVIVTKGIPLPAAHEHFVSVSDDPDVLISIPLRSDQDILDWGNNQSANKWAYDPVEDGIVATWTDEILDLAGPEQFWIEGWNLNPSNSNGVAIEIEMRWSPGWFNPAIRPSGFSHKLLRMDSQDKGHLHLPAIAYSEGYCTGCALPNVWMGGNAWPQTIYDEPTWDGNRDPIRMEWGSPATLDFQPGGDTGWSYIDRPVDYSRHLGAPFSNGIPAPFFVGPNKWVRFNWWWDWSGGDMNTYLWGWASDEDNDPVQTFGSIARPGDGLKLQNVNFPDCGGDRFRIEIDTSHDHVGQDEGIGTFKIWARNFVLKQDTAIDISELNGRPIGS